MSYIADGFQRGDYLHVSDCFDWALTTSGPVRGATSAPRRCRITAVTHTTLTTRKMHNNGIGEWLLARWEDCFAWPAQDFFATIRGRSLT